LTADRSGPIRRRCRLVLVAVMARPTSEPTTTRLTIPEAVLEGGPPGLPICRLSGSSTVRPGPRPPGCGIRRHRDDEVFEERVHRLPDRGGRGPLLRLDSAAADEGVNLALAYLKRETENPFLRRARLRAALSRVERRELCGRCWPRLRGVGHRGLSQWAGSRQFYHGRPKHARFWAAREARCAGSEDAR
jgi:hypothetical protein